MHADQAQTLGGSRQIKSGSIVAHSQGNMVLFHPQNNVYALRFAMLNRVNDRLLSDPE
jgi:hypothetical protein